MPTPGAHRPRRVPPRPALRPRRVRAAPAPAPRRRRGAQVTLPLGLRAGLPAERHPGSGSWAAAAQPERTGSGLESHGR